MTVFDGIVLIIVVIFVARSIWAGFVREIAGIAALVFGFVAAGAYYREASVYVLPVLQNPQTVFLATYVLVFALTYVAIIVLGTVIRKVMTISLLGWFDRALGGVFGLLKAGFVCSFLFLMLTSFSSASNDYLRKSLTYPYLLQNSRLLTALITDKDLVDKLMPKEPAIRSLLPFSSKEDKVKDMAPPDGATPPVIPLTKPAVAETGPN